MLFVSGILFLIALGLALDGAFLSGEFFRLLPDWAATLSALLGLGLAAIPYRRRKGEKKREWPMIWMLLNTFAALFAAGFWAWRLIGAAMG